VKNLYEPQTVAQLKNRIAQLSPASERQWGKMTPAQALAHCSAAMDWAVGDVRPPRMFLGRALGWIVKPKLLGDEAPMRRNSPTQKSLVVSDDRDLKMEQQRLSGLIDRFAAAGPHGCTKHPHSFFGPLTPNEWAILQYKHLDHHLRQFGA